MKTIKRLKWEKKLTVKELQHVREWGGKSLRGFIENRAVQAKLKAEDEIRFPGGNNEPCWECKIIARKLGLEV